MNTKFIVNDYVLIWNLLFGASISETIYQLKQKIWDTYRVEYNAIFKDKEQMLNDYKNFIPNNDTIYNIVLENKDYDRLRKQAEKYRVEVMKLWDKNKKETEYLIKKVIRKEFPDYTLFIVNKELNVIEHVSDNSIVLGWEIDKKDPLKILLNINMVIVMNHMKHYKEEYENIKKAVLELAILNEYATHLTGESCYQKGDSSLVSLKRCLYPYWLMYLGVPREEFSTYMMRDKIEFNSERYAYEKELKNMNIEEFIEFCIRNKRYIIKEYKEEPELL